MSFLTNAKTYVIMALVFILALLGAYANGQRRGSIATAAQAARDKELEIAQRNAAVQKKAAEASRQRNRVNDQVRREGPQKNREDLRDNWTRRK